MATTTEFIELSELQHGDTVLIDGEMETVNGKNIASDFFGTRYKGQRYKNIERVLFAKWYCGDIVGYFPQI